MPFYICRTVGQGRWGHPDQMFADLSVSQYRDWVDVFSQEPWGERLLNSFMARIVWAIFQKGIRKTLTEDVFKFKFGSSGIGRPTSPENYRVKSMGVMAFWSNYFRK